MELFSLSEAGIRYETFLEESVHEWRFARYPIQNDTIPHAVVLFKVAAQILEGLGEQLTSAVAELDAGIELAQGMPSFLNPENLQKLESGIFRKHSAL